MSEANEAKRSVVIGLAGFGTVGGAVYDVLKENAAVLTQRSGVQFRVKTVVCRSREKARAKAAQTLAEVRHAMRIDYFDNDNLLK